MSSLESSCTSRNVRVELRVAFAAQLVFEEMQESAGPGPFMIQTTLRDADGNALYRPGVGTVSRPAKDPCMGRADIQGLWCASRGGFTIAHLAACKSCAHRAGEKISAPFCPEWAFNCVKADQ